MIVRFPGFFEGTGMPDPGWWGALWPDPARVRGPATELRMTPDQTIASVERGGLKFRSRVEVPLYHTGAVFERLH